VTASPSRGELLRSAVFHTPRNPFRAQDALESFFDGGLLIREGQVVECGDFADVQVRHPGTPITDLRGGFLLPGFVDTHVHFPQVRVLGNLGLSLMEWLDQCALPEEARMAGAARAKETAAAFVRALASHGTTTALVFGSHFAGATAALFEAASCAGLRVASGLVLSDRMLRPELHQTPESAYRDCTDLIGRFHGQGRLRYAVTPRFALSASEAMLQICQALLAGNPDLLFQTHMNENREEIAAVAQAFSWASDYFAVYDNFDFARRGSVFAHNVHATDSELERLAASGAAVAHCPSSNAALGSGIFPLKRHLAAGVPFALGTDVGGGTGFGMLKEGLQAYLVQRLAPDGAVLNPAQLLYLATRAGAEALGLENETGDFQPGKAADFVYLRPAGGTPLSLIAREPGDASRVLAALFTLAGPECVREVRVEGAVVYQAHEH
jgi:guanine deaminase